MNYEENFISSILSEAQKKYNQKNYKEALSILTLLLTKNYKILSLRAKIYYNLSEFYKSLKDCEECLNLILTDNNDNNRIEIYQLIVLNHIKMFDLEWKEGDIIIVEPGDVTSFEALENSQNVVIKIPGVNNDKYVVE